MENTGLTHYIVYFKHILATIILHNKWNYERLKILHVQYLLIISHSVSHEKEMQGNVEQSCLQGKACKMP